VLYRMKPGGWLEIGGNGLERWGLVHVVLCIFWRDMLCLSVASLVDQHGSIVFMLPCSCSCSHLLLSSHPIAEIQHTPSPSAHAVSFMTHLSSPLSSSPSPPSSSHPPSSRPLHAPPPFPSSPSRASSSARQWPIAGCRR